MAKTKTRFTVEWWKADSGFCWHIVSNGNHQVIAHSEVYTTKRRCLNTAGAIADAMKCACKER